MLRQLAQRFRQVLRDEDALARIAADEFVVALINMQRREHSGIVAQNLLATLKPGFTIESIVLHVGASIGIAVFPQDAMTTTSLLQFADVAVKRLKAQIRWLHPERGMVSPANFIPVAEETGLILGIGDWVLEETCRQIKAWKSAGLDMPTVSVKLSARQFDPLLPRRIHAALNRHDLPAACLQLEITESLLVRSDARLNLE